MTYLKDWFVVTVVIVALLYAGVFLIWGMYAFVTLTYPYLGLSWFGFRCVVVGAALLGALIARD